MKQTNWTNPTKNPSEAMLKLISCLQAGRNAWLEVQLNGEQAHPLMMPNPMLDNPFNWTQSYATFRDEKTMKNKTFLNNTEKEMTLNWTYVFGAEEAIWSYQKDGKITDGLLLLPSSGIGHPVKICDANEYRKTFTGDNYDYSGWMTFWKPKDGIPYYVVDDQAGEVFVVCYDDNPVDMAAALRKSGEFMIKYADIMESKETNLPCSANEQIINEVNSIDYDDAGLLGFAIMEMEGDDCYSDVGSAILSAYNRHSEHAVIIDEVIAAVSGYGITNLKKKMEENREYYDSL